MKMAYLLTAMMTLLLASAQMSFGQTFTLYGNVINGATCQALPGVTLHGSWNNATNVTNAQGTYNLVLGFGNWSVSAVKTGYTSVSFYTGYHASGAFLNDFYLLQPGTSAANCTAGLHAPNSTAPTTIPYTAPTTVAGTTTASGTSAGSSSNNTLLIGGAVVVVIIIVVAYMLMKGKGKKPEQHHTEHKS